MLVLLAGDAGDGIDYDHADWADAQFQRADTLALEVKAA
jgi:hypothetical protein